MSDPHQVRTYMKALDLIRIISNTKLFQIVFKIAAVKDGGRLSQPYLIYILWALASIRRSAFIFNEISLVNSVNSLILNI